MGLSSVALPVSAVLQSIMRLSSLFGFLLVCSLLGLGSARGLAATATKEGTDSSKVETESAPKTYNPKEELKESQETKPDTESAGEELKEEIDELRDEEFPSTRFPFFPISASMGIPSNDVASVWQLSSPSPSASPPICSTTLSPSHGQ